MTNSHSIEPVPTRPLRLWPGAAIVVTQLLGRYALPAVWPDGMLYAYLTGVAGGLAVIVWWLFFSRAPWMERAGGILVVAAVMFATRPLLDKSIATGMMGMMFVILAVPLVSLAFVAGAAISRRSSSGVRLAAIGGAVALACMAWTLLRVGGIAGDGRADLQWRWTETHEEKLLARPIAPPVVNVAPPPAEPVATPNPEEVRPAPAAPPPAPPAQWPSFRGPARDSIVAGVQIKTDWSESKPAELWRRPVGPGWSSFAVSAGRIYTQEQRGDQEVVACYNADTGEPVWTHSDPARFWEANAGAGPRGTPTLDNGRAYTFGATGILNAIDAATGKVIWSRNAANDTGAKLPGWGFSSSPLIVDGIAVIATAGRLAAYDTTSGQPRWTGPAGGGGGYSSPHLLVRDGVKQILLMSAQGVTAVAAGDGKPLWKYEWRTGERIVQPAVLADGDLIISGGDTSGIRRVTLKPGPDGWTLEQRWESNALKPYFNDFVIHDGHAYGFDGAILACVDLSDGKRKWKGGRYGHGQLMLLRDQSLLLVISEEGEIALVKAATDQYTELARVPAIEGKTWNHPALAGDRLFVRNSEQMAAYRLPLQ